MMLKRESFLVVLAAVLLPSFALKRHHWSTVGYEDGVNLTIASPFFTINKKVYSLDDKSLK